MSKWIKITLLIIVVIAFTQINLTGNINVKVAHPIVIHTGLNKQDNKLMLARLSQLSPGYMVQRFGMSDPLQLAAFELYPSTVEKNDITFIVKFGKSAFSPDEINAYKRIIEHEYLLLAKLQQEKSHQLSALLKQQNRFIAILVSGQGKNLYAQLDDKLKDIITEDEFLTKATELSFPQKNNISITEHISLYYAAVDNTPEHIELIYSLNEDGTPFQNIKLTINPFTNKVIGIF